MSISLARRGASAKRRIQQGGGGFYANAINNPSAAGYPDVTNTGVPPGTTLTTVANINVTTNGTVIENRSVTNQIVIRANDVTIRNCRIVSGDYYPIDYEGTGLVVEDCEIIGTSATVTAGLSTSNYTARRCRVEGGKDGFKAESNVLIEDCYVTNLNVSEDSHNDGVQTTGGSNVIIRHNTFKLGDNAGVSAVLQFGTENGPFSNWLVEENLLDGGGWTINSQTGNSSMQFLNNRFTRRSGYGPGHMTNSIWTGNYFDDDGSVAA